MAKTHQVEQAMRKGLFSLSAKTCETTLDLSQKAELFRLYGPHQCIADARMGEEP